MKAVYIEERGGPEALIYGDVPDPQMADDQVLIRIRAASVNRFDLNARAGENGVMVGLPRVLGLDLAGEVLDAGMTALEAGIVPGARSSSIRECRARYATTAGWAATRTAKTALTWAPG